MNPIKQLFGVEEPVFDLKDEVSFLDSLWRNDEVPLRLRFMAAAEVARYRHATMRAIAHVPSTTTAKSIEAARMRAAPYAKVVKLEVVPAVQKALPPSQHSPDELKPNATSAANGGQSSSGFRRRI
jgi:hypothetical protein